MDAEVVNLPPNLFPQNNNSQAYTSDVCVYCKEKKQ